MYKFLFFLLIVVYLFYLLKSFLKSFFIKRPEIIFTGKKIISVFNEKNETLHQIVRKIVDKDDFKIDLIDEIDNYFIFSEKKSPLFEKPILYLLQLDKNFISVYSKSYNIPILRTISIPQSISAIIIKKIKS
jgi:DNA-dependent RNA polymerase auxiliary subunit epsilon